MDAFFAEVGKFLLTQGPFAVLSGVEGVVIFMLFKRLEESWKARIEERKTALEVAYKMMSERTAELKELSETLQRRGTRG